MDYWWLNWNTAGALLACIAVVGVPLLIWFFLKRQEDAIKSERLECSTQCELCGDENSPLAYLDFTGFEGWFVSSWKSIHYSMIVCEECAAEIVSHSRIRILKTFWRCFQGPIALILTFLNSRAALAKHTKSLRTTKIK